MWGFPFTLPLPLPLILALSLTLCLLASATPLRADFWTCETNYNQGPESGRLTVSDVYGVFVHGDRAKELGLPGDGRDVLRVNVFGRANGEIIGYQNDTNKLGECQARAGSCVERIKGMGVIFR